ncbi:ARM repeat-containing protein [Gyrodon lividus]|nr:ARM repeat-containing protein [Gyrodon lividus]
MTSNPESTKSIGETDRRMDALLNKSKNPSSLLPDELSYLVTAFVPSQVPTLRSKAYLILSAFCQGVRISRSSGRNQDGGEEPDSGTLALSQFFQPLIASNLSETHEDGTLAGITFHCALFQVDWQSATQIFKEDGFVELLATLEMCTSLVVSLALARLYAQASSHKACRSLFPDSSITWLRVKSSQTADDALRAVAVVALVKLSHGFASDAAAGGTTSSGSVGCQDLAYAARLKELVMSNKGALTILNEAVEGLAYLSVNPFVKKDLANTTFLKPLFSFVPKRKAAADVTNNSTLIYGILLIISNICAHKPRLSQEQQQIAKLRRVAESGKQTEKKGVEEHSDPLESEREVQCRCRIAISSGTLDVLATAAGLESQGMRTVIGQILLSLAENKENRGEVLKGGGAKTLIRIIQSFAPSSPEPPTQEILPAIQALAKLAITASPIQVFGPNEGNTLDAIRPLSQMLHHPSANMLQQFEAIMALTNLASHGTTCAARIANTPHLLDKVELLMLEDHTLIRRASTELICNLISGSENVFERYGGGHETSGQKTRGQLSKSKIQVLLAMSDVEDVPTRLAASGALATLTNSPTACSAIFELQIEHHKALLVLVRLIDPSIHDGDGVTEGESSELNPDPGLVHRGVVCIRNIFLNLQHSPPRVLIEEVKEAGLFEVFEKLLQGELGSFSEAVLRPAAEIGTKLVELSSSDQ